MDDIPDVGARRSYNVEEEEEEYNSDFDEDEEGRDMNMDETMEEDEYQGEEEEYGDDDDDDEDEDDEDMEEEEEEDDLEEEDENEEVCPVKQPCILIFDSLGGSRARQARLCATLREFMSMEYKEKYGESREFNTTNMPGSAPKVSF